LGPCVSTHHPYSRPHSCSCSLRCSVLCVSLIPTLNPCTCSLCCLVLHVSMSHPYSRSCHLLCSVLCISAHPTLTPCAPFGVVEFCSLLTWLIDAWQCSLHYSHLFFLVLSLLLPSLLHPHYDSSAPPLTQSAIHLHSLSYNLVSNVFQLPSFYTLLIYATNWIIKWRQDTFWKLSSKCEAKCDHHAQQIFGSALQRAQRTLWSACR
jgi:hypothetical protein